MAMRRLGSWLGMAALILQLAWPLVAGALPRSVALVPLCTVDGITHYLEVPAGKDLRHVPGVHGEHCPLCCAGSAPLGSRPAASAIPTAVFAWHFTEESPIPHESSLGERWARAPPVFPVVTAIGHEPGRNDEEALPAGRADERAPYRGRFVRLGLLHDQH